MFSALWKLLHVLFTLLRYYCTWLTFHLPFFWFGIIIVHFSYIITFLTQNDMLRISILMEKNVMLTFYNCTHAPMHFSVCSSHKGWTLRQNSAVTNFLKPWLARNTDKISHIAVSACPKKSEHTEHSAFPSPLSLASSLLSSRVMR